MPKLSNHTKAALFTENIIEQHVLRRENATVVQRLDYTLRRPRNDFGKPYGRMSGSELIVATLIGTNDTREYYERLVSNDSQIFSIVFNATYDNNNFLTSYDSAMVVEGYVVDIVEHYDDDEAKEGNQMSLEFSFLLTSITYIGEEERHLRLNFVN
ncbi:MAG: hypothetical protein PUD94_08760 [Prevotellaceae bacterium]|nr:hypothetical protein [Prevotellaceae bacterium]MDD6009218.1 hypothetical protein [Prevotellaceae bacterium]MDD6112408.1 hypothetical protein [Prevotellaceae bacterium]MDD6781074.1 hypothetical protein [Prevotellaceae bacterium]